MNASFARDARHAPHGAAARPPSETSDLLLLLLFGYVLVTVWRVQDLYPVLGTIRAPLLVAAASLVLYLLDTNPRRALAHIRTPLLYLALGMGLVVFASGVFGVWTGHTIHFLIDDFAKTLGMMVLLAASMRSAADVRKLAALQVLGGLLYCVTILSRFSVGQGGRLGNLVFYDANDLAMMLVVTLPLVLLLARFASTRVVAVLATLSLPIYLITIVKTGSRGGFLALLAVVGYLLFGFKAFSRRARITAVVLGALGFAVVASGQYWAMMGTMLNPTADYNFAGNARSGRMELWKRGMGYLWQYPVFGVGAANFQYAEGNLSDVASLRRYGIYYKTMVPHNSYVQIAAETGVVGIGLFVTLLIVAFKTASRLGRSAPPGRPTFEAAFGQSMVASLIGYCVAAFFLTQGFAAILYVMFAALMALSKPGISPERPTTILRFNSERGAP